jgi:glucose/arabinose dehydrogenase
MQSRCTYRIISIQLFVLSVFLFAQLYFNSLKAQPTVLFKPIIQGLNKPIDVRSANDGSGRLFICEQAGLIKIYKNGNLLPKPFLDLRNVVQRGKEYSGLYCVAFPLDYKKSNFFFVHYINRSGNTIIARYQASKVNPDSAIANSQAILFTIRGKSTGGEHMGDMQFAKDGHLYISLNDGSYYNNTTDFAQDGKSLLGKILRLDVLVKDPPYYKIPEDNPFINNPKIRPEIWAFGLRDAWRWSFDRLNGNMWITDVGGDKWEEVNVRTPNQPFGVNFGWPCYEGNSIFDTTHCAGKRKYTFPLFVYPHINNSSAEVITGGYVYRGSAYPTMQGYYICADYTWGYVWKIIPDGLGGINVYKQSGLPIGIVGFGEDENSELYAASLLDGTIYKVQTTTDELPIVSLDKNLE